MANLPGIRRPKIPRVDQAFQARPCLVLVSWEFHPHVQAPHLKPLVYYLAQHSGASVITAVGLRHKIEQLAQLVVPAGCNMARRSEWFRCVRVRGTGRVAAKPLLR